MIASVNRRPTVCQVVHSLNVGGAELLAATLARRLSDRCRFVFACLDELGPVGEVLRREGFVVEVLGRRAGLDWACSRRLRKFCRRENVRLIHSHQYTPFFQGLLSRLAGPCTPILFTEHGRHHPDVRKAKRVFCNRLLTRRVDRLVGVGRAVCEALVQIEGLPAKRVEVVYNGVDLSAFLDQPAAMQEMVRRELGLPDEAIAVMTVARLHPLKDHATAFRTVARLRQDGPNVRLILVGDGPERPSLEALARQLELSDVVQFLGTRSDVSRLLTAADIFLLTSISEGIPLTIIEAMAAGVPVVATGVGGVGEMIDDATGCLAPAGDDRELARHVRRLTADGEFRARVVANARRRAHERFSLDRMLAEYARTYEEMLHA